MSKYTDVLTDVEELFASATWTVNSIAAFPVNYDVSTTALNNKEFVKVEVIPGRPFTNYGREGLKGQIIIQIYSSTGNGVKRNHQIADILDTLLQNKELTRGTLTSTSAMSNVGIDKDDNQLFRTDYVVSFTKY